MTEAELRLRPVRGGSLASAPLTADLVEAFSSIRGEPTWMRQLRMRGWETYSSQPLPSQQDEGWRRTDLRGLDVDGMLNPPTQSLPSAMSACAERVLAPADQVAGTLVVQDSAELRRDLADELSGKGVVLMSLDRAIRERPEQVQSALCSTRAAQPDLFAGLHEAYMSGGAFVFVPRNVVVERPIQIVHAVTESGQSAFPHTLVIAETGADVTVLETYCAEPTVGEIIVSSSVELIPSPSARIQYVQSQEWSEDTWHFSTLTAAGSRDSTVQWVLSSLGGHLSRTTLDARLEGPGAETEIVGLVFGERDRHVDHVVLQDHVASRTRSNQIYKAALRDTASANFNGLIRVNEQAAQTWSNMEARSLLLSGSARADADPRLEILNSDVERCSHGATVGPMDEDALFYVMSRGIDRDEAQRLIVEAFFAPVLQRIPIDTVRDRIWSAVNGELRDGNGGQ